VIPSPTTGLSQREVIDQVLGIDSGGNDRNGDQIVDVADLIAP
jgi:hypothetical protein